MGENVRVDNGGEEKKHAPAAQAGGDARFSADREIEAAVDLMPVPAFICNLDQGTARYSNSLLESLLGVKHEEFIGRHISDFCLDPAESRDIREELEDETIVGGRQFKILRGDGSECWVETSSRRVVYRGTAAVLTALADIDSVKHAQLAAEDEQIRISALAEISVIIARGRPGDEMFDAVAEVVWRLVGFDRVGITLLKSDGSRMTLVYCRGTPIKGWAQGSDHGINESLNSYVTRERTGLVINSEQMDDWLAEFPLLQDSLDAGLKSFLIAPMVADDRVVGTISLRSKTAHVYSDAELAIVERVAALLAPALEQARLYADLEREATEREIIAEIGRVISASPDIDVVYDRFAELVRRLIPSDLLVISAMTDDPGQYRNILYSGVHIPGRGIGETNEVSGSSIEAVTTTRRMVMLHPHDHAELVAAFPILGPVWDAGLRSFLTLPLISDDRVVGVMHLRSRSSNAYTGHHVLLAESVAAQISGVISTSLLRTSELREAETNSVLAEIGRIMTSSFDKGSVFERFAQLIDQIVPCDRLVLTTIDADAGTATDIYVSGISVPGWGHGTVHKIAATPFEELIRNKQIQWSDDLREELEPGSAAREAIERSGLRSSIMAPLISNGEVIGSMNLKYAAPGMYTTRHVELAERIADQIAGVIANARLYDDLQRVANERRALSEIGLAATQDLDLNGVFERTADALLDVVAYDRMAITILNQDDGSLNVAFVRGEQMDGLRPGDVVTPEQSDMYDGESWVWQGGLAVASRQDGRLDSLVQASLGSRVNHLGYIRLRSNAADAYDQRSREMLEHVATYLTPAIQNALDHQQAIHLAEERERSLMLDIENQELQRSNEAKNQFLETVTHELKTPLTSIAAFTDILLRNQRGGMTDKDLSQLVVIQRNGRRLGNLIDDLLDLNQIDHGGLELAVTEFDVAGLIAEVADRFRVISEAKSQRLVCHFPDRPVNLRADRDRLAQVLTNLISNASKYSPAGSLIEIASRRWKDRLYFSVTDHGSGISIKDQESLFTLFFRADNEVTRSVPGTGIGLYVARTIVDLHGGEITVTSPPGEGATVSFYVPGASADVVNTEQEIADPGKIIPWSRLDVLPERYEAAI